MNSSLQCFILFISFFSLRLVKGKIRPIIRMLLKGRSQLGPQKIFLLLKKLIRLKRYNEKSLVHEKDSSVEIFRSDHMFFSVVEGQEGNIWIGTIKGVFRYDGRGISYFKKK